MAAKALAAVQVADRKIELQEFDLPGIGPNEGLLRIEACGICGSDYEQYNGELGGTGFRVPYPSIYDAGRTAFPTHAGMALSASVSLLTQANAIGLSRAAASAPASS